MGRGLQGFVYNFLHSINLAKNLVIPEPQYTESLCFQPGITFRIIDPLITMLATVCLNNQLPFKTYKIDDVRAQKLLPAKFIPVNLSSA
jgi:hypothetical protein